MSLLKHGVVSCSAENLSILSERCRDPAVSVKKKAMQCLMDLLAVSTPFQPHIIAASNRWIHMNSIFYDQ